MSEHTNTTERPPIIAIMGHIDHGKSTLLSFIRKSLKPLNEAGGITQHVSAYEVVHTGADGVAHPITFIDTPGHEAFSGIRSRGARVADVAILVVSAEDGVKPQTIEAYKAITSSDTPCIIAINKIDKPSADIERTKMSLTEHEIYIEGYGGDIPFVPLSAKTGEGVPDLLDMIVLVSEMSDLRGDHTKPAQGIVIESNRDEHKGISATCIITEGTLSKGMFVVSGESTAPVRSIYSFEGKALEHATFSSPVSIVGWDTLPTVGETFHSAVTREDARDMVETYATTHEHAHGSSHTQIADGMVILPVIIKADTGGSLEAVEYEIGKLKNDRVCIQILSTGIGAISENDVRRALGKSKAVIIGFNVDADSPARNLAERSEIEIKSFTIIYKITEWLAEKLTHATPKIKVEESTGLAKVLKTFSKVKDKQILGGKVEKGTITLGSQVRIIRRDTEIGQGKVKELQEQKNRTDEVSEGKEFGTLIEAKVEIAVGDRIESFIIIEK